MTTNLKYIFNPKSIAVVGVSQDPQKLASVFFNNLIEGEFKGKLYPVNPKYDSLYGYKAFPNLTSIPGKIDQVAILVPSKFVLDIVKDCVAKKVKVILLISAGFSEIGEQGQALEREIARIAKENHIRLVGPNIIGALCPKYHLNSSWAQSLPKEGHIAFVSQSGAFCTAVLDMALSRNLGFSHFLSIGNKADVHELDLFKHWNEDKDVSVMGAYIEEIEYGQELIDFITSRNNKKPVIIYKPGKTQEAVKAIASHTGSMAGSVETIQTAFQQFGIIEVNTPDQLFNAFMTFSWFKALPKGNKVAVITNAGGPGIMATDKIINHCLNMAKLSTETQLKLKDALPVASSTHNPVDVLGDAWTDRYQAATEILMSAEEVDMILYLLTPQFTTQVEETSKMIIEMSKHGNKPVYPVYLGEKYTRPSLQRMFDSQVPAFRSIRDAVFSMMINTNYQRQRKTKYPLKTSEILKKIGKGRYSLEIEEYAMSNPQNPLPEEMSAKIATEVGLGLPKAQVCKNLDNALKFASKHYPVVIKAPNSVIAHKTDFRALYLNLRSEKQLIKAYQQLEKTIVKQTQTNKPEILIQEMIQPEEELLIGANRDGSSQVYIEGIPGFGHLLVFGKGGIYTEIYKDLAYALVPADRRIIEKALFSTKVSKILKGARGNKPLAWKKVIDTIEAVQKMVLLYPKIKSLDINPLLVTKDRAIAVDVKIFVG